MASNESRASLRKDRFQLMNDRRLDASDICHQRARSKHACHPLGHLPHFSQGSAENDEISPPNHRRKFSSRFVYDPQAFAFDNTGGPANAPKHSPSQTALPDCEPERPTQQAHAD
jgi:hypothetical protein